MIGNKRGFTLIEIMASVAILSILMVILLQITDSTQKTWSRTKAKVSQFKEARNAFESINRNLRQATLNTYWDYQRDSAGNPQSYVRTSELRFIAGNVDTLGLPQNTYTHALFFQAPFGYAPNTPELKNLLNTRGYYIELTDGTDNLPNFIASSAPQRWRLRLMEMVEPAGDLTLYDYTGNGNATTYTGQEWYTNPLGTNTYNHVLAENIIALIVRPKNNSEGTYINATNDVRNAVQNIAPDYFYDSSGSIGNTTLSSVQTAQLPPVVQVVVVAIDEASARRLTQAQMTALADDAHDLFSDRSENMEANLKLDSDRSATASLENIMANHTPPISYRVYSSNVNISGSRWSGVR
ncbi:MAG: Verru_Chthon cassette protein C [Verrucomicrobiota bacterium]